MQTYNTETFSGEHSQQRGFRSRVHRLLFAYWLRAMRGDIDPSDAAQLAKDVIERFAPAPSTGDVKGQTGSNLAK